ncbi:putative iron-regulated membrane protein [Altererythrobacter atlanticus]|uniref:Uncharacterized protein n=1 Tax=Croceibacterium atlanticum TaxID=1267766 RepID=A0A0F7KQ86_9SPHN|nr:PepSY-associated TM helix domain-containing protein [Croceibacterium atlanticum]AKH42698.1 hypothetical protein WYH_01662 [Croceibacterium atlanticum]MBB5731475.1 putative iron-regulated membrane protein [Croceibacterium atlanticum]
MNMAPDTSTVKKALSAHAAIGLVAGALLYLICLTGTVVVFYEEWQWIEQPDAPEMERIAPEAVQRGVEAVMASEADREPTTHLYVHLPVEDLPRATISTDTQAVHLTQDGSIANPEEVAWSDFLLALHYRLNLPSLIGITIVGALGVMIVSLAISGVIAHPRIFRDAFRLRARNGGGIALADWHNRMSVWTLPFSLAIALTGAVIGLASIAAYGLGTLYYDGDLEAVYAPIFGEEGASDATPAPAPDVARALGYMQANYPDVVLTYAILHDPGTQGQHIQMVGEHPRRLIFGEYYDFDAAGNFAGTAGLADGELGQQTAASIYNLHFGNFGGLPVKIAYVIFGLALTAICATGTYIWLGKRRRRGLSEPRLLAAWDAIVWGTPLALAIAFAARLLIGNAAALEAIFWLSALAILVINIALAGKLPGRRVLQSLLVIGCTAGLVLAA